MISGKVKSILIPFTLSGDSANGKGDKIKDDPNQ
jgi:hypothetical protein